MPAMQYKLYSFKCYIHQLLAMRRRGVENIIATVDASGIVSGTYVPPVFPLTDEREHQAYNIF